MKVVAAADALLKSLTEAQRTAFLFRFRDEEQRVRWSNLPTGIFGRKGLRMGDLRPEQPDAVIAVLRNTLSDAGYQQVVANMEGEERLNGDGRRRLVFGKDEYYFSILETPSLTAASLWQFGGHHLAINATVIRDRITLAPSLTGGQNPQTECCQSSLLRIACREKWIVCLFHGFPVPCSCPGRHLTSPKPATDGSCALRKT